MTVATAIGAPPKVWTFEAIGTLWHIETEAPLGASLRAEIDSCISEFDRDWSRFREDSVVCTLSRGAEVVPAPADTGEMLDAYVALSEATSGAVNPLVGDVLARRGYDAAYSFVDRGPSSAPRDWQDCVAWTPETLRVAAPAVLDVGALGKGRLVDRVADVLTSRVGGTVVVDAGGDIAVRRGTQRIGLEHPFDPSRAIGVWTITNEALCASAVGRRAWGDGLHHVLDARTGVPVRTVAATWAVAETAMHADAIATALFFEGGEKLAAEWGVSWVRMTTAGRVEWSPGNRAELHR